MCVNEKQFQLETDGAFIVVHHFTNTGQDGYDQRDLTACAFFTTSISDTAPRGHFHDKPSGLYVSVECQRMYVYVESTAAYNRSLWYISRPNMRMNCVDEGLNSSWFMVWIHTMAQVYNVAIFSKRVQHSLHVCANYVI